MDSISSSETSDLTFHVDRADGTCGEGLVRTTAFCLTGSRNPGIIVFWSPITLKVKDVTAVISYTRTRRLFVILESKILGGRKSNVSTTILPFSWGQLNSSWKCLIDVHLSFISEYERMSLRGTCYR